MSSPAADRCPIGYGMACAGSEGGADEHHVCVERPTSTASPRPVNRAVGRLAWTRTCEGDLLHHAVVAKHDLVAAVFRCTDVLAAFPVPGSESCPAG